MYVSICEINMFKPRIICLDLKKNMDRKIFRRYIYGIHPTVKVAHFFFLHVTLAILEVHGHDIFAFCLEFSRDSQSPTIYKQLCQIMKFY